MKLDAQNLFFTSDTHLNHDNIRHLTNRPYESVGAMNNAIVANWNSVVTPESTVIHLGDVGMGGDPLVIQELLNRLNGKIFLVAGNHDTMIKKTPFLRERFTGFRIPLDKWDHPIYEITVKTDTGKRNIVLSHFPLYSWHHMHRGTWHLHGHCHGNIDAENSKTTRFDVGIDNKLSGFKPFSFDQLEKILSERAVRLVDHHGGEYNDSVV